MNRLRIRYAILGLVFALLWVGHQGEPAWVHAARVLLVLVTIPPLLALTQRFRTRQISKASEKHPNASLYWLVGTRIVVISLALALGWLVSHLAAPHANDTVRQLAVRIGVFALTMPFQIRYERQRQARGLPPRVQVRSPLLMVAKFGLVLVALGAEWLIGKWTADADVYVAIGMFAAVAVFGPMLHPYLFHGARKASGERKAAGEQSRASSPPAPGEPAGLEPAQGLGVTD
jgi:heme A synthase